MTISNSTNFSKTVITGFCCILKIIYESTSINVWFVTVFKVFFTNQFSGLSRVIDLVYECVQQRLNEMTFDLDI